MYQIEPTKCSRLKAKKEETNEKENYYYCDEPVNGSFLLPINTFAYTINDEYNLAPNQGDSRLAIPNKIILHETGIDAPARNVAANMKNNYNGSNSYTTDVIGDGGIVYRVGEQGYVSWGAGNANPYAPVQIELQRTYDKALFEKTIELILNIQEIVQKIWNSIDS